MKPFINKFILASLALTFCVMFGFAQQAKPQEEKKDSPAAIKPAGALQKQVIAKFTAWDKNLKSLKTDYEQVTSFEGTEISSSQGRLYKSGNNIRIETLQNGKITQSAVTDKKIITVYDDKGEIVTSLSWQDWQASQPNKALFDFGNYSAVLKEHKIKEFAQTKAGYKLVLTPADADGTESYLLEFLLDTKDCFPLSISLSNEGIKTQTVLKNTNKNVKLEERLFK